MKYAWWFIVGLILFLFCTQNVLASESTPFDVTKPLTVRSIPEGSREITPDTQSINSSSETYSKPSSQPHPDLVSPTLETHEAGPEGELDLSSLTYENMIKANATILSPGERKPSACQAREGDACDIEQERKNSWFSSALSSISNGIKKTTQAVTSIVQNIYVQTTQVVSSVVSSTTASISHTTSSIVNTLISATKGLSSGLSKNLSKGFHTLSSIVSSGFATVYSALTHPVKTAKSLFRFAKVMATIGTGILLTVLFTSTGRTAIVTVAKMSIEGVFAAFDLVIQGGCIVSGSMISLFTGSTISQGFMQSTEKLSKWTGYHVRNLSDDFKVLKRNAIFAGELVLAGGAIIFVAYGVIPMAAMMGTNLALMVQETPPELMVRFEYSLAKTGNDCTTQMGQCDDVLGAGITLAFNTILGVNPVPAFEGATSNFSKMTANYSDDTVRTGEVAVAEYSDDAVRAEKNATTQIAGQSDDATQVLSKLNANIDLTKAEVAESRLTKNFIDTHLGGMGSQKYLDALEKYPNAMKLINENEGHILLKHFTDESYQIARSSKIGVASNFNSVDDMLESVESTLVDKANIKEIEDWITIKGKKGVVRVYKDMGRPIGKNYILLDGKQVISESNKVTLELKDVGGEVIINSGYPSYTP